LPTLATLALLAVGSTAASAQGLPQPPDQNGATVREILSRAETESRRRSIGDILGGIAGISRAEAQAAPATPPGSPVAASEPLGTIAIAQSTTAPPASASGPIAQVTGGSATPPVPSNRPAAVSSSGAGTPADPTMIVTVPATASVRAGSSAPAAAHDRVDGAAAASSTPAEVARRGSFVVATGEARQAAHHSHRSYGYVSGRDWCPPGRW